MAAFTHLRVASAYSMRYGASTPESLVAAAARLEMPALALTDRDGLYGAPRFAQACARHQIAPIIGVDFAVRFSSDHPASCLGDSRTPARGGASEIIWRTRALGVTSYLVELPRVTVWARPGQGWAQLCHLTSLAHRQPDCALDIDQILDYCLGTDLVVGLGADSEFGNLLVQADGAGAARHLTRWADLVCAGQCVVDISWHQRPSDQPGSLRQATAMLTLAERYRVPAVLSNRVRMAHPHQQVTCQVLDCARWLVEESLTCRSASGQAWLKPTDQMFQIAQRLSDDAGTKAERLWNTTCELAESCQLDICRDMGIGQLHLPKANGDVTAQLRARCEQGLIWRYGSDHVKDDVRQRLDAELDVIAILGFEPYFLTVDAVVTMIRQASIRCAARGSGAGSLVNYLLGISSADPLEYGLIMERFLSVARPKLPDIDLDVEAEQRPRIYRMVFDAFRSDRVACVAMSETYRVRHAIRDVGRAWGMPVEQITRLACSLPHIRAGQLSQALRELPELSTSEMRDPRFVAFVSAVESLDGLPRHLAMHPCGVIISDARLASYTPIQPSSSGFNMSQFDKDDVEALGFVKLDILGVRMQSALAYSLEQIKICAPEASDLDIDDLPAGDPQVYSMIAHGQTVGCFQIESPGQRELVRKLQPRNFHDIIVDISLFRPGPVKSDMVTPFLRARGGWEPIVYLDERLQPILADTCGVVIFHEQVIEIIAEVCGVSLAEADLRRRQLADPAAAAEVKDWFFARATVPRDEAGAHHAGGFSRKKCEQIWAVLESFAFFGFCKAHAAAFAVTTYQSAWMKAHWPAAFIAGLLSCDPGMYPKRLIVDEARRMGIDLAGVDVNRSRKRFTLHRLDGLDVAGRQSMSVTRPAVLGSDGLPDGRGWQIRAGLSDIKGIDAAQVDAIIAGQPYSSLGDFVTRVRVDRDIVGRLIRLGAFDSLYGIQIAHPGSLTRRDLLLHLERLGARTHRSPRSITACQPSFSFQQSDRIVPAGLTEMTLAQHRDAELEILGYDFSSHILSDYRRFFAAFGITCARDLPSCRTRSEVWVAGAKVASQTPGLRSGRRVVFLTLDDSTGLVDVAFFPQANDPDDGQRLRTLFSSWLVVVAGTTRKTGGRAVSVTGRQIWDLKGLYRRWRDLCEHGYSEAEAADRLRAQLCEPRSALAEQAGEEPSLLGSVDRLGAGDGRKLWHSSLGSAGR